MDQSEEALATPAIPAQTPKSDAGPEAGLCPGR